MNVRTVTIIVVTSIPIIVVAYFMLEFYLSKKTIDEQCGSDEVCVRYCCEDELKCDAEENELKRNISEKFAKPFRIIKGRPCEHAFEAIFNETIFLENGHIIEDGITYHWDQYCVDYFEEPTIKLCAPENFHDEIQGLYIYFMLASIPFLIITLVVYGFIKDLRNLHGKCLIAYVSSLTIMYTTLIINAFQIEDLNINHRITCITIGYTFLTSVLCCFFWLNVMCYDIYRTFKKGMKAENNVQFFKYCGYAFGIPVLISFINFILNNFELIPESINNGIGRETCSIPPKEDKIQWIYIYGPIVLLLTVNISFYGITAWKIFHVQQETSKVVKSENSQRHSNDNHTRFLLYMRLSIVMGVPWIIEILSFMFVNSVILFIASIFNCMQGFVVFITFVWNPKVTKQLKRRYTAMSVSYKKHQSSTKRESAKGESVKGESVDTAVTKINGIYSESSAQV